MISNHLMGDVRPAVEPGTGDADYGSAVLEAPGACEVRSWQSFTLTYSAGRYGMDDTGGIRVAHRFTYDGGKLQTTDPGAPNYVSAHASGDVGLDLYVEPEGERPWHIALRVTVVSGFLRAGDTITLVYGDRSHGSPGFLMQTFCENGFAFRVSVDACATGQFRPLPRDPRGSRRRGPAAPLETGAAHAPPPRRDLRARHQGGGFLGQPDRAGRGQLHAERGRRALRPGRTPRLDPGTARHAPRGALGGHPRHDPDRTLAPRRHAARPLQPARHRRRTPRGLLGRSARPERRDRRHQHHPRVPGIRPRPRLPRRLQPSGQRLPDHQGVLGRDQRHHGGHEPGRPLRGLPGL